MDLSVSLPSIDACWENLLALFSPDGGFKARLSNRAFFFCIGLLASVVCSPLAASTDYRAAWLARFDSCRMHLADDFSVDRREPSMGL